MFNYLSNDLYKMTMCIYNIRLRFMLLIVIFICKKMLKECFEVVSIEVNDGLYDIFLFIKANWRFVNCIMLIQSFYLFINCF